MTRFTLIPALLLCLTMVVPALGQTPEEEVRTVIETLFNGMRAGDSTLVSSTFHPSLKMSTTAFRGGEPIMIEGSKERFLTAVGTPHDAVWDEQIWDLDIKVRDNLASAWMNYAFFAGGNFSHCGVNSIQLYRSEDGWKMIYLVDTRQKENCEMPPGKN